MKKNLIRFILLIFIFISFISTVNSQNFIAKVDTSGVVCETTSTEILIKIQQISPETTLRLYGFRFAILFDQTHLSYNAISYVHGAFIDSAQYVVVGDTVFIKVDTIDNPNPFNSGTLFTISFSGIERGLTRISFVESECEIFAEEVDDVSIAFESMKVLVHQGYIETFLEQTNWGCSYENKGQAYITVLDGAPPYTYQWQTSPYQTDTFAQGLTYGTRHVYVTDRNRCVYDQTIDITVLPAPKFEWEMSPDPAIIDKIIKFSVTDAGDGMNWYWKIVKSGTQDTVRCDDSETDIFKCDLTTEYVFDESGDYSVMLSANNVDGCDTTVELVITVLPIELEFKNVVSPNNRFKVIVGGEKTMSLADAFSTHELLIYNRIGSLVYKSTDFPIDGWDGGSLSNGTYYYVLKATSLNEKYYYRGNLVILGKE